VGGSSRDAQRSGHLQEDLRLLSRHRRQGWHAPSVAGKPTSAIVGVVTSHPPPMNKIELTNDEIAAVARYVSSLKK
jgi:hypothetical protein